MTHRRVILGPYAKGVLRELDRILNDEVYLKLLPRIDVSNFFYTCMVQYGAEAFDVFEIDEASPLIPSSKFLSDRITRHKSSQTEIETKKIIMRLFDQSLPVEWMFSPEYEPIHRLANFLSELLLAAELKESLVTLLPIPNLQELRQLLPPEIFILVDNFLSFLSSEELIGPKPRQVITSESISDFQKLIESDVFNQLATSHSRLDSINISPSEAKESILKKGDNLIERFSRLVEPKKIILLLLSGTQDIVDALVGRVGGVLAQLFIPIIKDIVSSERRVVIYEMTPTLDRLVEDRRSRFARIPRK